MSTKKFICENCGNEHDGSYGSGRFCSDHCRRVYCGKRVNINGNQKCNFNSSKQRNGRKPYGTWKCERCNLIFETRAQLFAHNHEVHPILKGSSWNKGLTKETDARIAKYVNTLKDGYKSGRIKNPNLGKVHSEEFKQKVSQSMKKFFKEHPDRVPYLLNHSSKESYPEKYFRELFENEGIVGYKKDLPTLGYFLDFGFEKQKIDFEVDGSQHWNDPRIVEHDMKRNKKLIENGWTVIRIRWDDWQKKNKDERKIWIEEFKNKLNM